MSTSTPGDAVSPRGLVPKIRWRSPRQRRLVIAVCVTSLPLSLAVIAVIYFFVFGEVVATVPLAAIGRTGTTRVAIAAGARVQLTVHASRWSQDDCKALLVHTELLRAEAVVAQVEGNGFDFDDGSGGIGSVAEVGTIAVPAGGIDGVRATALLDPPSCKADFHGLEVEVRRPRF